MDDNDVIVLRLRAVGEILMRRRPKDLLAALQLLESLAQASETAEQTVAEPASHPPPT